MHEVVYVRAFLCEVVDHNLRYLMLSKGCEVLRISSDLSYRRLAFPHVAKLVSGLDATCGEWGLCVLVVNNVVMRSIAQHPASAPGSSCPKF
jgi:hypothetical protein